MGGFTLLFVLPDKDNQHVLLSSHQANYKLPAFSEVVEENVGFDIPEPFNAYFLQLTGIAVFRRYSFIYKGYVVFVLESVNSNRVPKRNHIWMSYDDAACVVEDQALAEILQSVQRNYNESINMPWVNQCGLAAYIDWACKAIKSKEYKIIGKTEQIKNAYVSNVFLIPTNRGKVYLKIPGMVYIKEIPATQQLMNWGIIKLPKWLMVNETMNAVLTEDMGGNDLPSQSDIHTFEAAIKRYAQIQKNSIEYIGTNELAFNDYRITTICSELEMFPTKTEEILRATDYRLALHETTKLRLACEKAKQALSLLDSMQIPDTVHHGDLRPGNIRLTGNDYAFYDWSWSAVSHPFIDISQFLHIIRRTLPTDIPAKEMLIERYLEEWTDYESMETLRKAFNIIDDFKELFMSYADYRWVADILIATDEEIDAMSADGWLLSRRLYYFMRVLKRFMEMGNGE